jgi:hypothetical protein
MPRSVINRRLLLDRDCIEGLILEHIAGLIRMYNVCAVKNERARDLLYDIIFLDSVTTHHFSQFQLMWPHHRRRCLPFWEWWAASCSYIGQMFDETPNQLNSLRWNNPRAFGNQVDRGNSLRTRLRQVRRTSEGFSLYGSDDLRVTIEPPSCCQYKPGDFLAV